jgi:hypothetical protein
MQQSRASEVDDFIGLRSLPTHNPESGRSSRTVSVVHARLNNTLRHCPIKNGNTKNKRHGLDVRAFCRDLIEVNSKAFYCRGADDEVAPAAEL